MPNPDGSADMLDIQLLRTEAWLDGTGAHDPGDKVNLTMPEMGLQGPAWITGINGCPVIKQGPGRLVLGTVTHLNGYVMVIHLKGLAEPLEPTATHPLFSEDRQAWVRAGELREGERLRTLHGAAEIVSIARKPGVHRVYNLEVQTDHVYYVSPLGVLAHNDCPGFVSVNDVTVNGRRVLPNESVVVRGGTNEAGRWRTGSGVVIDEGGRIQGASVNSKPGLTAEQLAEGIPNGQIGVSTVGQVRGAGGNVVPSPTLNNPNHATLGGLTPEEASRLFTPTVPNPCKR